jgi:hypothetical protein
MSNITTTVAVNSQVLSQPYGGSKTFTTSSTGTAAVQETFVITGSSVINLVPNGFSNMLVGWFANDTTTYSSSVLTISGSDGTVPIGGILVPGASTVLAGSGVNTIGVWAKISGSSVNATASLQYTLLPS